MALLAEPQRYERFSSPGLICKYCIGFLSPEAYRHFAVITVFPSSAHIMTSKDDALMIRVTKAVVKLFLVRYLFLI
ncbi:MAG: hypothetical protein CME78_03005 [Halomonas sp.]|nr:hypothetical protein [Halomonas sp.]